MADETIFRVVEFTYPCGHSGFQDVRGWSDDEIDQMIDTMTHEPSMCDDCFSAYIGDDPDLAVMMLLEFQSQLNIAHEIIQAMANLPSGYSHEAGNYCVLCHADDHDNTHDFTVEHTADCPVTKARAYPGWLARTTKVR